MYMLINDNVTVCTADYSIYIYLKFPYSSSKKLFPPPNVSADCPGAGWGSCPRRPAGCPCRSTQPSSPAAQLSTITTTTTTTTKTTTTITTTKKLRRISRSFNRLTQKGGKSFHPKLKRFTNHFCNSQNLITYTLNCKFEQKARIFISWKNILFFAKYLWTKRWLLEVDCTWAFIPSLSSRGRLSCRMLLALSTAPNTSSISFLGTQTFSGKEESLYIVAILHDTWLKFLLVFATVIRCGILKTSWTGSTSFPYSEVGQTRNYGLKMVVCPYFGHPALTLSF